MDITLSNKNWQRLTLPPFTAVPSALKGLTSLFGMGRGGHLRYNHHIVFSLIKLVRLIPAAINIFDMYVREN